ncbi:hypothetical protein JCM10213_001196 [Rhodosporidiobolus nylandii]
MAPSSTSLTPSESAYLSQLATAYPTFFAQHQDVLKQRKEGDETLVPVDAAAQTAHAEPGARREMDETSSFTAILEAQGKKLVALDGKVDVLVSLLRNQQKSTKLVDSLLDVIQHLSLKTAVANEEPAGYAENAPSQEIPPLVDHLGNLYFQSGRVVPPPPSLWGPVAVEGERKMDVQPVEDGDFEDLPDLVDHTGRIAVGEYKGMPPLVGQDGIPMYSDRPALPARATQEDDTAPGFSCSFDPSGAFGDSSGTAACLRELLERSGAVEQPHGFLSIAPASEPIQHISEEEEEEEELDFDVLTSATSIRSENFEASSDSGDADDEVVSHSFTAPAAVEIGVDNEEDLDAAIARLQIQKLELELRIAQSKLDMTLGARDVEEQEE